MRGALAFFWLSLVVTSAPALAGNMWLPVREISLEISPGSPLDFSGLVDVPAGGMQPVVVTPDGHLARAGQPLKPVRFFCASLAWSPASGGFPDHETADRYARQLRMHGYTIARFHFIDASLMSGRSRDFDFDPDVLDRIHYLMAALKKNGIYWIVDGMSSARGALGGFDDRWDNAGDLKLSALTDDEGFAHWLRFQTMFLGRVNPYTGIAPVRDPALVAIVPMNENGLEFDSVVHEVAAGAPYPERLKPLFNVWLARKYGSTQALRASWGWTEPDESIEASTVSLPKNRHETGPRMRDLQAFFIDVEVKGAERMTGALRQLGYRGIVVPYNNWPSLQASLSRRTQQAVAMNTYQDWVGSYASGTAILGTSSLEDGAAYMRAIAATRWLGRPFLMTEYDHLFWNSYRYEAGLVMPAYAALQNWDVLCRHGHGPIILAYGEDFPHKRQMLPYAIALDPVARASETLAALLYGRGDVSGSPVSIPFLIDGEKGLTDSVESREPEPLTRLALVSAIGLKDAATASDPGMPAVDADRSRTSLDALIAALSQSNISRTADGLQKGLGISDTGEIRLDANLKQITVSTARTEAIAYADLTAPVTLGAVTVAAAKGSALFAVSSLDGRPVGQSRRLLVIFATDARNSGMLFSDADDRVIADFGHLPVMIRKGDVQFRIANAGGWRISPVGLDGTVHSPVAKGQGEIDETLTNDAPSGPTTFFLIERD